MSHFVLVHGSWHGGWCWYKIAARLRAAGHQVFTPDLPALGVDSTPIAEVTLASWIAALTPLLEDLEEPAILVGHSRGGLLISALAEALPSKVSKLVYLCAFVLRDGESLMDSAGDDAQSKLPGHLQTHVEEGYVTVAEEGVVTTLDTAHSPFFSAPDELAAQLLAQAL